MQRAARKVSLVKVALVALLVVRLGLAWIAFSYPQRSIVVDSIQYLELADSIRTTGSFEADEYTEEVRTPGYPLFLAAVQALFGEHIGPIILVQLILTVLIAWLLYQCGKLLNAECVGLAAAFLYALNPNALFWSLTILTETYFSLLLILSFYTLLLALQQKRLGWFVLSGLLLGMATITRPIGLYLIPIWTLSILLWLRKRTGVVYLLKFSAAFLIAALLLVLYWQTHNLISNGRFSLSTTTEVTIVRFIASDTLAEALHIDRDEARLKILNEEDPMAYSFQVITQHPVSFVAVTIRGVARSALGTDVGMWTWLLLHLDQSYQSSGLLTALARGDFKGVFEALSMRFQADDDVLGTVLLAWGVGYAVALYVLIALGMVRVIRSDNSRTNLLRYVLILLLISAFYLVSVPLSNGDPRFRVPAAPLLALLSGLAFLPRAQRDRKKDKRIESSPNNLS